MEHNRICSILGIRYPIIQGALNWLTDASLVAAVSEAGGMGVLGPNAGAKWDGARSISTEERYRNELEKVRSLTGLPFAVNIILPIDKTDKYFEKVLDVALEEGVKIFVTVGGVDKEYFKRIKQGKGILIHREYMPTTEAAKHAEGEGADIIVATGYDEGGSLPPGKIGTFSIVPAIVDAVSIPVMAAGGINDIRGVRAAFALGAEGVYVGTRFIVSKECPASSTVKQDIIHAKAENMVYAAAKYRSIPHKFSSELAELFQKGTPSCELEQKIANSGGMRPAMLEGKLDGGIVSVNTAIDLIHEVKSCDCIVKELMADFI